MKKRSLLCLVVLLFALPCFLHARGMKKHRARFKFVEVYSQRIIPGMRRSVPPPVTIHVIVVWEGPGFPETFYWRGDTGLLACTVVKAHKIVNQPKNVPPGKEYYTENVALNAVQKGDTLDVMTIPQNKALAADGLPKATNEKHTLFYKTDGRWYPYNVGDVARKRDILMP